MTLPQAKKLYRKARLRRDNPLPQPNQTKKQLYFNFLITIIYAFLLLINKK